MMNFRFIYWTIQTGRLFFSSSLILLSFAFQTDAQTTRFSLTEEQTLPLFSNSTKTQITPPKNPFNTLQIAPIPKTYCYEDLAVFCKLEVKLEKTFKFPIKIRLGEVNYVEMLEGKPYTPDLMMDYE